MIGGREEVFERTKPLLAKLSNDGQLMRYIGTSGKAAQLKALVNMVMNINTAGLAEGLGLANALGLDLKTVMEVFSQTGANSRVLQTDGEDMQNRDHSCFFSASHAAKDSGIALALGKAARRLSGSPEVIVGMDTRESSPWIASQQEPPDDLARKNARSGVAWAFTVVNRRHPEITANFLATRGEEVAGDDSFACGAFSSLIMAGDMVPGDENVINYGKFQPDAGDPAAIDAWNQNLGLEVGKRLEQYRETLRANNKLDEVFRYHSLPKYVADLEAAAKERGFGFIDAPVSGGQAGAVNGKTSMTLKELSANQTELMVETDVNILGKIGEFGQPIIRKKADSMLREFVDNIKKQLAR